MKAFGKSITGLKRSNNEDAFYICNENCILDNLYIIADGMGGHKAGEVASSIAINAFNKYLSESICKPVNESAILDIMVDAIQTSNKEIYKISEENPEFLGMGTTFDAAVVCKNKIFIAHVGDSRVYIMREKKLFQVTKDHSLVMEMVKNGEITMEEALVHPNRNIITRALGTKNDIEIDTFIENINDVDIILMCTDGLTNMIKDSEIENILNLEKSVEEKLEILVDTANNNGGLDNISVILISQEV